MSGRTGKMTREALADRGPRFVLARLTHEGRSDSVKVIYREDTWPFTYCAPVFPFFVGDDYQVRADLLAKSYSLGYLRKIAKFN